jgi:glycerophosphoryl diester phosphodiesterase
MPNEFAIIAHRGDSANAPQNTIAAFDLALERGFAAFETDAQLLGDGTTVVLIHGSTLERTTNGHGPVADASPAAVQALDAGSWFSPDFAGDLCFVFALTRAINVVSKSTLNPTPKQTRDQASVCQLWKRC